MEAPPPIRLRPGQRPASMNRLDKGTKLEIMKHLSPANVVKMGNINKEFQHLSTVQQHNLNPALSKIQRAYRGHLKKVPELQEMIQDLVSSRQHWARAGPNAGPADMVADSVRRDLADDRISSAIDGNFFFHRDRLRRPIDFGFTGWWETQRNYLKELQKE